ncbi:MAG: efflux RND transporter periplasmic adaptor subunit [Prevotellaceae bacterium]|jgi:RND family efflux transporter MFP subunit|nr:efflux RND transporter periplasmic adaptor subunit [Prevotellaceae bacterium]
MKTTIKKMVSAFPLLGIGSLLLLAGCGGRTAPEQTATTKQAVEVRVETVREQSVEQIQEYTGDIIAYSKNMIASQTAMRIEKIHVEVGDYVKAGQLLVQMEETAYLQAKLQLENLKTDYSRSSALHEAGGLSKQVIDQLKTQLDVTEESIANLHKNTYLLSPIAGIVTSRMFDNGDMTGGQPILQVQQLKPVKIKLNIQEQYFSAIKPNMRATIKLDVLPGEEFAGKVHLVYPTVDAVSHTVTTEIVWDNSRLELRPGMFARVVLNFGDKTRVVVPDRAIVKQPGTDDRYVYVLKDNHTVAYTKVVLGQRLGDRYEVLSGLNDGDRVAVAGISKLINGTEVSVVK